MQITQMSISGGNCTVRVDRASTSGAVSTYVDWEVYWEDSQGNSYSDSGSERLYMASGTSYANMYPSWQGFTPGDSYTFQFYMGIYDSSYTWDVEVYYEV